MTDEEIREINQIIKLIIWFFGFLTLFRIDIIKIQVHNIVRNILWTFFLKQCINAINLNYKVLAVFIDIKDSPVRFNLNASITQDIDTSECDENNQNKESSVFVTSVGKSKMLLFWLLRVSWCRVVLWGRWFSLGRVGYLFHLRKFRIINWKLDLKLGFIFSKLFFYLIYFPIQYIQ